MDIELLIQFLQWAPVVILVLALAPMLIHLLTYARHRFGSGFAHITYGVGFITWTLALTVAAVSAGLWSPGLVDGLIGLEADPGDNDFLLSFLPLVGAGLIAVAHLWGCYRYGRCVLIDGKTGAIRYYGLYRMFPAKAQTHVDLVEPLVWANKSVDVWGITTLEPLTAESYTSGGASGTRTLGDIPEAAIKRLIARVNAYLGDHQSDAASKPTPMATKKLENGRYIVEPQSDAATRSDDGS